MSEDMAFELAQQLNLLRSQPARNPAKAAQGRAAFLVQAQAMSNSLPLPVTNRGLARHIGWMHPLQTILKLQKKEQSPMFGVLGTILLIVSLVLGGSGVTVAAAQNSQPDQILYPVKTWSEDVRVQMSNTTQTRLELALEYSQRRAEEMRVMLSAGQVPPDAVQTRMQAEIDLALRLAAGQPDGEALKSLEQIRLRLQEQARLLEQVQLFADAGLNASVQGTVLLERTHTMLQDRLHLCDLGIQDPAVLRDQLRERDRDRLQDGSLAPTRPSTGGSPWITDTPTPGSGYGPGVGAGSSDGGSNPWMTGTPTPGSGYGPGSDAGNGSNPWTTGTPTSGSGYGPGPEAGAGIIGGGNPWTTGTPTPGSGSGYGPGPGSGAGSGGPNAGGSGSDTTGGNGASGGADSGAGAGGNGSGPGDGSGCGSCDGSGAGSSSSGAGGHGEGGPGGHH